MQKDIQLSADTKMNVSSTKLTTLIDDIKRLKREITDLKNDINIKEKELSESRLEIQQLIHENQQEKETIKNETDDLKRQIKLLEKENRTLKIKLKQKDDPINDDNSVNQDNDKHIIEIYSCKKCNLHFSSKETLNKHKSKRHRSKLTF